MRVENKNIIIDKKTVRIAPIGNLIESIDDYLNILYQIDFNDDNLKGKELSLYNHKINNKKNIIIGNEEVKEIKNILNGNSKYYTKEDNKNENSN